MQSIAKLLQLVAVVAYVLLTSVASAQMSGASSIPNSKSGFTSFDFPGSTNTQATAITPSGEIVGRYFSSDGRQHGFVLSKGAFTSLDVPGASFTDAAWVNAQGDIAGTYTLEGETQGHAYVLSNGTFTTIDFPPGNVNTAGFGISNAGDVVGVGFIGSDFFDGQGYLFRHNEFTVIDLPGAKGTFPTMVIDSRRIVGTYVDANQTFHGFFLNKGAVTTIDFPGSTFTWITGINPEGEMVGFYYDQAGNKHGFVLRNGNYISFDIPGATGTAGNGIDPQGDVVGQYTTPDGNTHGYFLANVE